jgi:CRISPR-associated protein Cmr3
MTNSIHWYEYIPVDTVVVRGAEPENQSLRGVFPPPSFMIEGAIRTAYLFQKGCDPRKYKEGQCSEVEKVIGKPGEPLPFHVIGPFFKKGNDVYIPVPALWYGKKEDKDTPVEGGLCPEEASEMTEQQKDWITCDKEKVYFVRRSDTSEKISLVGYWMKWEDFSKWKNDKTSPIEVRSSSFFYEKESRTGVALTPQKTTREGKLYIYTHYRLYEDVTLVFGIDGEAFLDDTGILKIGGEQRFGRYRKVEGMPWPASSQSEKKYMALSFVEATRSAQNSLVATGKVVRLGGWDMAKAFHKPVKTYYMPGTVFSSRIDENMIEI